MANHKAKPFPQPPRVGMNLSIVGGGKQCSLPKPKDPIGGRAPGTSLTQKKAPVANSPSEAERKALGPLTRTKRAASEQPRREVRL